MKVYQQVLYAEITYDAEGSPQIRAKVETVPVLHVYPRKELIAEYYRFRKWLEAYDAMSCHGKEAYVGDYRRVIGEKMELGNRLHAIHNEIVENWKGEKR